MPWLARRSKRSARRCLAQLNYARKKAGQLNQPVDARAPRRPAIRDRTDENPPAAADTAAPARPRRRPVSLAAIAADQSPPRLAQARQIRGNCPASPERPCAAQCAPNAQADAAPQI